MIVDQDIYDHLEHHGVKGMRWGVRRRIARQQKNIDRLRRTASGTGNIRDRTASALLTPVRGGAQKSAQRQLDANQRIQKDILAGKRKARDILLRAGGVNVRYLNYSYSKARP